MISKVVKRFPLARLDEWISTSEGTKFVGRTQSLVRHWRREDKSKENPNYAGLFTKLAKLDQDTAMSNLQFCKSALALDLDQGFRSVPDRVQGRCNLGTLQATLAGDHNIEVFSEI